MGFVVEIFSLVKDEAEYGYWDNGKLAINKKVYQDLDKFNSEYPQVTVRSVSSDRKERELENLEIESSGYQTVFENIKKDSKTTTVYFNGEDYRKIILFKQKHEIKSFAKALQLIVEAGLGELNNRKETKS